MEIHVHHYNGKKNGIDWVGSIEIHYYLEHNGTSICFYFSPSLSLSILFIYLLINPEIYSGNRWAFISQGVKYIIFFFSLIGSLEHTEEAGRIKSGVGEC